jgi:hypothetical protein
MRSSCQRQARFSDMPEAVVMLAGPKSFRRRSLGRAVATSSAPPPSKKRSSIGPATRPYGASDEKP